MTSNLPEKAKPTTLGRGDLVRFARLEGQIEKALKVAAEPIGAALRAIRDGKLYLATHSSFERYVVERWGFSKATAYRMMNDGKLVGISSSENASSQVSTSHGETNRGEPSTIGSPPPAEQSEGVAPASETVPEPRSKTPSDPSSGGARTTAPPVAPTDEADPSLRPAPLDPPEPCCGHRDHSPGPCACPEHEHSEMHPFGGRPAVPPERPPSDRQLAARVFAAMREINPTDAGPVTTPEEATFLRQWSLRTLDAWKAVYAPPAPAEKPQRRQGTITRPADRAPKPPVKVNGSPVAGSLTRRTVTPMFKP